MRPSYGIFVETRLRHRLASGEPETRVVAAVPRHEVRYSRVQLKVVDAKLEAPLPLREMPAAQRNPRHAARGWGEGKWNNENLPSTCDAI